MPSHLQPLCYYYPTMAIILDDSEGFLTKLSLELDTDLAYLLFNLPEKALDYVKRNTDNAYFENLIENTGKEDFGINSGELQTKADLSKLYQKIYNPRRFNEPTVVVTDYSMPNINGYQVCQELMDHPIKKLMLTGEADDPLAVRLFNEGLLDKFLLKFLPDYGRLTNHSILELQRKYFASQSKTLLDNLKTQDQFHSKDPAVNKVFYDICKKHNIVEYYMISSSGSYLLISFEGKISWFVISNDSELQDCLEVALDQRASPAIIKLLKERKKVPYFPTHKEYMTAQGNSWEPYLHTAEKIVGQKNYFYSFVEDEDLFEIDRARILSFKDYLENEWPPR